MEKQNDITSLPTRKDNTESVKKDNKKIILVSLFLVLFIGLIYLLFSYIKTQRELKVLKDPAAQEAAVKVENDKLIQKINKLIDLPTNEEPVVGTVNDASTLAQQQKFFSNAKNGDKVLIYQDKAIIYRPDDNKLINVGPVYVDSTSTESNINNK
ncbi:MAG: hypothetical protein ACD_18C00149G0002 [uncultured bacterium]|nr:MAG: hypothetical protein ACD_18C00149G0002 [uncultured bacterium]OGH84734.1 MAG: hypothetical protein A2488_03075 [Candidatus Magasanikbacteria bacterium RIFOXYC12_FULL_32_21b]OGH88892.1 MAG: hypothetical protein A2507_03325 [Candidatus Magasanikbacteria bacterium RIFOXYD12_FULL_33_17]HAO52558.1 hypothetical protein [Candidatus Magasanikbacteria bacterium]